MMRLALALLFVGSVAYADGGPATGSVKGTVIFEGEAPTQPVLKRDSDPKCSKDRADEAVVVTKGKLRDVLVRIKNGSLEGKAPKDPVVLDQHDCMYTPRVVGLVVGQKVTVRNSDPTFHNVWGTLGGKDVINKAQPPKAPDVAVDPAAAKAGDVLEIKCGVHPWMHAYAVVQDHPYFAVTGADGAFEIKGLPVGTYTLEAWHPVLGSRSITIQIGKAKRGNVTARFSYKQGE